MRKRRSWGGVWRAEPTCCAVGRGSLTQRPPYSDQTIGLFSLPQQQDAFGGSTGYDRRSLFACRASMLNSKGSKCPILLPLQAVLQKWPSQGGPTTFSLCSRGGSLVVTGQLRDSVSFLFPPNLEKSMIILYLRLILFREQKLMVLSGLPFETVHCHHGHLASHNSSVPGDLPCFSACIGSACQRGSRARGWVCLFARLPGNEVTVAKEGLL